MSELVGKTISHYKITGKIGEGGMGVIYKAEDTKLGRKVALKFLPQDLTRDSDANERFIFEAQSASSLDHANICSIHEIDETENGQTFIVMAYYDGESLRDRIKRSPLAVDKTIDIALQITRGLSRTHEAGIVHRDIKPSNLVITTRNEIKIIDFGLAKLTGQHHITRSGTTLGTVPYMSPEQALGETIDHRTDIWSTGVVMYEMLTGQLPFKGDSDMALIYSILNEQPEPILQCTPEVPPELEAIVSGALEKTPESRYQQIDDLRADLKSLRKKLSLRDTTKRVGPSAVRKRKSPSAPKPADRNIRSLAVLPFGNMSGTDETEYLSDGITESLINNLAQLPNFKVISRTSVFHYKNQKVDFKTISRELGVGLLLMGWIVQREDHLSIGAELVDPSDGSQIWGDRYSRKITDFLQVQEEIAQEITSKLKLKLTRKDRKQLSKYYRVDSEAYQLYLKGRYYWNKRTADGFRKSIEYFNLAIAKDPAYPLAYTGLSGAYALIGIHGFLPAKEVWPKAKAAALKSLELDDTLAETHAALAAVKSSYEWDWRASEPLFQRAIELNPNYATAHQGYAGQLWIQERFDEALHQIQLAQEIDPLSLQISTDVGRLHHYKREYDQAIQKYGEVIEFDPNFFPAYFWLGMARLQKSEFKQGLNDLHKALELSGGFVAVVAALGYGYAVAGQHEKAKEIIKELRKRSKQEYVPSSYFAWVAIGLKEIDKAFSYIDKAYEERSWWLVYFRILPSLDNIRGDPRYSEMLGKIGLA